MNGQIAANSSFTSDPSIKESWMTMDPVALYSENEMLMPNQVRPSFQENKEVNSISALYLQNEMLMPNQVRPSFQENNEYNYMKGAIPENSSIIQDPSIKASWMGAEPLATYLHNVMPMPNQVMPMPNQVMPMPNQVMPMPNQVMPMPNQVMPMPNQAIPFCPANRERDTLTQDLEMFWAQQRNEIYNFTELPDKSPLPLARIKRVMKSDPEVKMVSSDTPVLLAKACEIFIQELTLRSWFQTESCSRHTIRAYDIYEALVKSDIYEFMVELVSFEPRSARHRGESKLALHQQVFPPANVNVPDMKDPMDMTQLEQDNLMADRFINTEAFELNPNLQ